MKRILLILFIFCFNCFGQLPIFWNGLGDESQITNSYIGNKGEIGAGLVFSNCKIGNGTYHSTIASSPFWTSLLSASQINSPWTVEFWWKTGSDVNTPDSLFNCMNGNEQIAIVYYFAGIGIPGQITIHAINYNNGANGGAIYSWTMSPSFVAGELIHIGAIFDQSQGARGKLRLFQNGVELLSPSVFAYGGDNEWNVASSGTVYCASSGIGYPCVGILDNYKIYNYAKTSFADRFIYKPKKVR